MGERSAVVFNYHTSYPNKGNALEAAPTNFQIAEYAAMLAVDVTTKGHWFGWRQLNFELIGQSKSKKPAGSGT
jgi:hypothetical protein